MVLCPGMWGSLWKASQIFSEMCALDVVIWDRCDSAGRKYLCGVLWMQVLRKCVKGIQPQAYPKT